MGLSKLTKPLHVERKERENERAGEGEGGEKQSNGEVSKQLRKNVSKLSSSQSYFSKLSLQGLSAKLASLQFPDSRDQSIRS